ncbi:hypothetical protein [Okeania sp. SIO2B3]|uniref:hypothetical protein n=1 Tax=Okeania sp. SIO2B3 TaxID=2607784 RepID=UPI0013BF9ED8|nr:hypothetical protein [Okeania sp. SIO2B3]NET40590.1 hypothetical protein [Okeania sp. SIO2B3]
MGIEKDLISIKSLGNLIFWHEEIIELIRFKSQSGLVPNTNDGFYKTIGFKPTFYSAHSAKVNQKDIHIIAFTKITKDYRPITKIMGLREETKEINLPPLEKYEYILGSIITRHINEIIAQVISSDDFDQNSLAMGLFVLRVKAEKALFE